MLADSAELPPTSKAELDDDQTRLIQFECSGCPYVAKRKNTLKTHQAWHCPSLLANGQTVTKNRRCKFCDKAFTYNGLRHHINGFINAKKFNRKPRGKHEFIKNGVLIDYLEDIKIEHFLSEN